MAYVSYLASLIPVQDAAYKIRKEDHVSNGEGSTMLDVFTLLNFSVPVLNAYGS
jgi:hypothetical protein